MHPGHRRATELLSGEAGQGGDATGGGAEDAVPGLPYAALAQIEPALVRLGASRFAWLDESLAGDSVPLPHRQLRGSFSDDAAIAAEISH